MNIFIITVDECYFIPRFLEGVIKNNNVEIIGIGAMPPTLSHESTHTFAFKLFKAFGLKIFMQHCLFYGKYFLLDLRNRMSNAGALRKFVSLILPGISVNKYYSVKSIAMNNSINFYKIDDVNSHDFISKLQTLDIDVIVSVAATQLFKKDILNMPKMCCINLHSSLLPEYRGVSPSFWTMLNGEDKTGVTVHYMDEKIDSGDIIVQNAITIEKDDTVKTLNEKVSDVGAASSIEALKLLENNTVKPIPLDITKGSYFSVPDRDDVRRFTNNGRKFF